MPFQSIQFTVQYLKKYALYSPFIHEKPHEDLFLIVVIPCFNEHDIITSLNSLWICKRPNCAVEIIIVINASENSNDTIIKQNKLTEKAITIWLSSHYNNSFRFFLIIKNNLPAKDAGVGLARKIGMDEAIHRFEILKKNEGVIISFDADCTCQQNYLCEIERLFKENSKLNGCSIQFEHPLEGDDFDDFTYYAVAGYELYLRYYISALRFAGHPFAYQTIGSSFAIRADVYCKQGGMNKRKAGEDFYFLQKVIQLGNYADLNSTKVFSSPRPSDRVPFGTGAVIEKMQKSGDPNYFTYNLQAFDDIADIVRLSAKMYGKNEAQLNSLLIEFSMPVQKFLIKNNFVKNVIECIRNSSSQLTFLQRFFKWFNMFKVLKFMNYSHPAFYSYKGVEDVAKQFLLIKKIKCNANSAIELCKIYRKFNL
ncbi:MAG: family 2 glycosyl transferase [Bacteroidetes bacterium CG23_combo_of_CG06-09_8_20_14_all_32_9]|nr:MAG: family 2 glycosyl transferase [Bacteroidetes bacterium CG23_combo_of_CG06-09_8_20_14_all_32_9]